MTFDNTQLLEELELAVASLINVVKNKNDLSSQESSQELKSELERNLEALSITLEMLKQEKLNSDIVSDMKELTKPLISCRIACENFGIDKRNDKLEKWQYIGGNITDFMSLIVGYQSSFSIVLGGTEIVQFVLNMPQLMNLR